MAKPRKLPSGRYQISLEDARRGIPRFRRTFDTAKQCRDFEKWFWKQTHQRLFGAQRRYLFGEALGRYLNEISPEKSTHADDKSNARALRVPFWNPDAGQFARLEHVPLEPYAQQSGELWIIPALNHWLADQRQVEKRSRLGGQIYQRRRDSRGPAWYEQPEGAPRKKITDPDHIARLDAAKGAGPFSDDTLRVRLALAKRILNVAWRQWDWTGSNISEKIQPPAGHRRQGQQLTEQQIQAALAAAGPHFDDLILAGMLIGWRKAKVITLEWSGVVFPVYNDAGELLHAGMLYPQPGTATKKALPLPMDRRVEQLIQRRWELRTGPLVFHDGQGNAWGDFRRRWTRVKREAGIPDEFVFHGLRYVWTADMVRRKRWSAPELAAATGWTLKTAQGYVQLHGDHIIEAVRRGDD